MKTIKAFGMRVLFSILRPAAFLVVYTITAYEAYKIEKEMRKHAHQ